jgi:hypothetical protein
VKAIIVTRQLENSWRLLLATLGSVPIEVSDVALYRLPPEVPGTYGHPNPADKELLRLEMGINLRRYAELLLAADQYVSRELPADRLTPWEAERLNLLPPDRSAGPVPDAQKGTPWHDDLWLGRWPPDSIGVGLTGCRWVLEPIMQKFAPYARMTSFPYPSPYKSGSRENHNFGRLLMVFSRSSLHRAADVARLVVSTSQEPHAVHQTSVVKLK